MRHTRAHRDNRRSHHALTGAGLAACPSCGKKKQKHKACPNCGTYKGREVVNVTAAVEKKQGKRAKKEKEAGQKK